MGRFDVRRRDRLRHLIDPNLPRRQLRRVDIHAHRVLLRAEHVTCATPETIEMTLGHEAVRVLVDAARAATSTS